MASNSLMQGTHQVAHREMTVRDCVAEASERLVLVPSRVFRATSGSKSWALTPKEIKKKLSDTDYDIDTNISAEIEKENETLEQEQALYISQEGNQSSKHQKLEEDLQSAKIDYDRLRSELNRPVLTKFEKFYFPFFETVKFCLSFLG